MLKCDPHMLESVVARAGLELVGSEGIDEKAAGSAEVTTVEAVVSVGSPLIGASLAGLKVRERFGMNLLAMSRRGRRMATRLRRARFRLGDVLVLQGSVAVLPDTLAMLNLLPLAERHLALGQPRHVLVPLFALAAAVTAAAVELVPPALAFTAAAVALVPLRVLTLREVYDAIDWPVLVLLGALIPVGEAVHDMGAAELLAAGLAHLVQHLPALVVLASVIALTMVRRRFCTMPRQ